jgi:iron(III) transport system permease protein
MILNSFQLSKPGEHDLWSSRMAEAFSSPGVLSAIHNTFSLALARQFIALILGIVLAWLLARTDIPLSGPSEFMFWLSFFFPALPVTIGWILLLDPKFGLVNQWLLKLPFISEPPFNIYSFGNCLAILPRRPSSQGVTLAPAFRNMDAALEESSRVSGASAVGTLIRIIIPVMMPAILVATILGLIRSWRHLKLNWSWSAGGDPSFSTKFSTSSLQNRRNILRRWP